MIGGSDDDDLEPSGTHPVFEDETTTTGVRASVHLPRDLEELARPTLPDGPEWDPLDTIPRGLVFADDFEDTFPGFDDETTAPGLSPAHEAITRVVPLREMAGILRRDVEIHDPGAEPEASRDVFDWDTADAKLPESRSTWSDQTPIHQLASSPEIEVDVDLDD